MPKKLTRKTEPDFYGPGYFYVGPGEVELEKGEFALVFQAGTTDLTDKYMRKLAKRVRRENK